MTLHAAAAACRRTARRPAHADRLHTAAGVPEGDPADDALDFALQFELIKKSEAKALTVQQIHFADASSFGIPRCVCCGATSCGSRGFPAH